jgi:2'-5' RNA ligase
VTLARVASEAPAVVPATPVTWHVDQVVLVESLPDGRYVPVEHRAADEEFAK